MSEEIKGQWGGKRPNTGGKREGAGRKPSVFRSARNTFSFYIKKELASQVDEYSEMSGHSKGEIVEIALTEFFGRLKREGFADD